MDNHGDKKDEKPSHFSLKENKFYVMYKSLLLFNSEKTFKACVFENSHNIFEASSFK